MSSKAGACDSVGLYGNRRCLVVLGYEASTFPFTFIEQFLQGSQSRRG